MLLFDLVASVSTIPKSVYDNLNLGPYATTEIGLNMGNSTFTQEVGIKHGVIIQINDCLIMIGLVIVDMPEDPVAPIILGRPFLRTIKAEINVFEGNVRFDLPAKDPFVRHFPRKKKMKTYIREGIVVNAMSYDLGVFAPP